MRGTMDVSYGHDTKNNFMVIKLPFEKISYKLKMIEKNEISGLLKIKYTIINGEIVLKYNISSKNTIKNLYSKEKINNKQLRDLLQGIIAVWDLVPNYLLDADNIVLTNEMIYIICVIILVTKKIFIWHFMILYRVSCW